MSVRTQYYHFHGLVSMRVIGHERDGFPGFSRLVDPFPFFRMDALSDEPDIILELGEFEAHPDDCYLVDHKYHVRRNYLYCEDGWQNFRWKVEIDGFESGQTRVRLAMRGGGLRGALVPGLHSRMLLTRQLLTRKFRERDCELVHAAGAARNGQAVVLFGRGGSYKTSVLMSLLRSAAGWCALGDDGVILKRNQALSFPTYPDLFTYRVTQKENENLTYFDRFKFMFKPLSFDTVYGMYASSAELAALVEMRAGGVDQLTIEEVPLDQNATAMQNGMRLEAHNSVNLGFNDVYPRYLESYSYVYPQNGLNATWEFGAELAGMPSYRVTLPLSPKREDLDAVIAFLKEVIC